MIQTWVVAYRYSQLEKLNFSLSKRVRGLPSFPGKKFFKNQDSVVQQRKIDLQKYLNGLLLLVDVINDVELSAFLEFTN